MNTELDDRIDTSSTQQLPWIEVPVAPEMVDESRRFDRTLLAAVGVAAASLIVGSIAMFGPSRSTHTGTAVPTVAAVPTVTVAPVTTKPTAPEPVEVTAAEQVILPLGDESEPAAEPAPVPTPPAPVAIAPVQPAADVEPAATDEAVATDEAEADPGDPDPNEPEVNPCMVAADAGEQFFAPTAVVLEAGVLGGSFRIGSCTPEPLAIELSTVPGVLVSQSDVALDPSGTDIRFMIVPELFEGTNIEFEIEVYEVGCCAGSVTVTAEKTWGLGELTPFDPGIFEMLAETDGIDPSDAKAVTDQFIAEYGWHPGYLDDPRAFLHDEEVHAFIEQYGLESPWVAADN